MRVRVLAQTDIRLGGEKRALFDGQDYSLPVEAAEALIQAGKAVSLEPTFQEAPVYEPERAEEKAVHGPPEDKAVTLPRAKRKYRRRR